MRGALGYSHRRLVLRRSGISLSTPASSPSSSSSSLFSSSLATSVSSVLVRRRHITSFKGQLTEFLENINGERAALVYFYTAWCEPCNRINVMLKKMMSGGLPRLGSRTEITVLSNSTAVESSSKTPATKTTPLAEGKSSSRGESSTTTSSAPMGWRAQVNPEELLKSATEACMRVRANDREVRIIPVNTDENPKLGALHDIRSVPTFVTYRDGCIVGRLEGYDKEQIKQLVEELVRENVGDKPAADGTKNV